MKQLSALEVKLGLICFGFFSFDLSCTSSFLFQAYGNSADILGVLGTGQKYVNKLHLIASHSYLSWASFQTHLI